MRRLGSYISKSELRQQSESYRRYVAKLAYENARLRRQLEQLQQHHSNTEDFLAVLQGEQIAEQPELN